jgi:CxxC motif-containing protein
MSSADNLSVDGLSVTGNRCPRGAVYAREEIRAPKRVVTATCRVEGAESLVQRVPVKTVSPCPREKIPALLADIYKTTVALPVKAGDVVIADWNDAGCKDAGINVIATRTFGYAVQKN